MQQSTAWNPQYAQGASPYNGVSGELNPSDVNEEHVKWNIQPDGQNVRPRQGNSPTHDPLVSAGQLAGPLPLDSSGAGGAVGGNGENSAAMVALMQAALVQAISAGQMGMPMGTDLTSDPTAGLDPLGAAGQVAQRAKQQQQLQLDQQEQYMQHLPMPQQIYLLQQQQMQMLQQLGMQTPVGPMPPSLPLGGKAAGQGGSGRGRDGEATTSRGGSPSPSDSGGSPGGGGGAVGGSGRQPQNAKEKNRQAQRRFRERQKSLISDLKRKADLLTVKVAEYESELALLREENTALRGGLDRANVVMQQTNLPTETLHALLLSGQGGPPSHSQLPGGNALHQMLAGTTPGSIHPQQQPQQQHQHQHHPQQQQHQQQLMHQQQPPQQQQQQARQRHSTPLRSPSQ